jgi:hypothetical protein
VQQLIKIDSLQASPLKHRAVALKIRVYFTFSSKESFAKEVFQWCGGTPHGRKLTCTYYNKERDKLEAYASDTDTKVSMGTGARFIINISWYGVACPGMNSCMYLGLKFCTQV